MRVIPKIEGHSKVNTIAFVKNRLAIKDAWAIRACIVIYDQQSKLEKKNHIPVNGKNGCGFSKNDCPLLTAIACKIKQHRQTLQDVEILKRRMPKYAAQVICLSDLKILKQKLDIYYGGELPF